MSSPAAIAGPAWDLESEYARFDAPELLADLAALDLLLDQAQALHGSLQNSASVASAQAMAKLREQSARLLANVSTYANCLLSVDSQHEGAQILEGQLQNYRKRSASAYAPLNQFLNQASETAIAEYLNDAELIASGFAVHHQRRRSHEQLSLAEENLVSDLSQNGLHAWGSLYSQLSGNLTCEVLEDNETHAMGIAQAAGRLSDAHEPRRKNAWQAINSAWQDHSETCAAALNAITGWRLDMAKKRSASHAIHYLDDPVHQNRISRQTLDTLMSVAAEARPLAQRAAKLQARAYGKTGFGPWDSRAPAPELGGVATPGMAFDDAVTLISDAYAGADPSMGDFVNMMVEKGWVEGTVGPHKRPGAYCTRFAKSRTPRVYMTYSGSQSDIITLAHELGHAYHNWVMRDLPDSQRQYGMSLAETASIFGETLVRDALLARASHPQQKLNILWEEVSAFTTFLLNIPTRFEFERNLYDARVTRPLRAAELNEMMSEAWLTWYGEALAESDPMFWASKLHFFMSSLSFYNFPYLFGYLFSLGVYTRRTSMGNDFHTKYIGLLADTGRMSANEVAQKHLAVDLEKPEFWRSTIARLAPRIDAFEVLLNEIKGEG